LPKGWGDFGRQIGILVAVDLAYTFVRGIVDSEGVTAVVATHDPLMVALADRELTIADGRVET
jgi:ABC-type lipoprotein export system ATPase subunit